MLLVYIGYLIIFMCVLGAFPTQVFLIMFVVTPIYFIAATVWAIIRGKQNYIGRMIFVIVGSILLLIWEFSQGMPQHLWQQLLHQCLGYLC